MFVPSWVGNPYKRAIRLGFFAIIRQRKNYNREFLRLIDRIRLVLYQTLGQLSEGERRVK